MTKREMVAQALIRLGYTEESKSSRRWVYVHPSLDSKMFIGKAGGLRTGRVFSRSLSMTHRIPQLLRRSLEVK